MEYVYHDLNGITGDIRGDLARYLETQLHGKHLFEHKTRHENLSRMQQAS